MIVFQRWYVDGAELFYYDVCYGLGERYFGNDEWVIDDVGTEIVEGDLGGTYYTCAKVI